MHSDYKIQIIKDLFPIAENHEFNILGSVKQLALFEQIPSV